MYSEDNNRFYQQFNGVIELTNWIVINSYCYHTLSNQLPLNYLIEKGYDKERYEELNNENSSIWQSYITEKKEGMIIYIVRGSTPLNSLYKKNIIKECPSESLESFSSYTPDRYKVWSEIRTNTVASLQIIEPKLNPYFSMIDHNNMKWKIVDITKESVCEECCEIYPKDSQMFYMTNRICENCKKKSYKMKSENLGSIYFVRESINNMVKIGKSINVKERVANLQAGTPYNLNLLIEIPALNYDLAERCFHKLFLSEHINKEWYSLNDEDIIWIKSLNVLLCNYEYNLTDVLISNEHILLSENPKKELTTIVNKIILNSSHNSIFS